MRLPIGLCHNDRISLSSFVTHRWNTSDLPLARPHPHAKSTPVAHYVRNADLWPAITGHSRGLHSYPGAVGGATHTHVMKNHI